MSAECKYVIWKPFTDDTSCRIALSDVTLSSCPKIPTKVSFSVLNDFQKLHFRLPISGCAHRLGVNIAASATVSELETVSSPGTFNTMFNVCRVPITKCPLTGFDLLAAVFFS